MDGVELQILWSNVIGIVSEQARALKRVAFSPIVREAATWPTACSTSVPAWSPRP